jgi:hypothetical protein
LELENSSLSYAEIRKRFLVAAAERLEKEQVCQIFIGTTYQNGKKYTKWPQIIPQGPILYQTTVNRPNGHKIYKTLPLQDPKKFPQIGIFGLKIYLATLRRNSFLKKWPTCSWPAAAVASPIKSLADFGGPSLVHHLKVQKACLL